VAIRFLVESVDDGATATASTIASELHELGRDVHVVVTRASAANKKADQLARALAREDARHEVVVVIDSDVLLTSSSFEALVLAVTQPRCDAAWAPPIEANVASLSARISSSILDSSLHSFALLSGIDPRGMVGKAMALRRDALDAAGGFGESLDRLGEDMHLAARLRDAGQRIVSVSEPVLSLASHRSLAGVLRRYARWIAVIRGQRAGLLPSYPLLFAAAPLQLALAAVALVRTPSFVAFLALLIVIAGRVQTAVFARTRARRSIRGALASIWLADIVLLAAFVVALTTRRIRWRNSWLRLDQGRIFEVER
jgi:ceramide glucosyltransferase